MRGRTTLGLKLVQLLNFEDEGGDPQSKTEKSRFRGEVRGWGRMGVGKER